MGEKSTSGACVFGFAAFGPDGGRHRASGSAIITMPGPPPKGRSSTRR
jgi:hypothetical protein